MVGEKEQVCYDVQVWNSYDDFSVAMSTIENFEIEKLLYHLIPRVRTFSFIAITKCVNHGNVTNVYLMAVIYNKNDWKVNNINKKTIFYNGKEDLVFLTDGLMQLPCDNQNEMINEFNIISNKLTTKGKFISKLLKKIKV